AQLVQMPGIAHEEQSLFADLLTRQLSQWPDDAEAWIGDRAAGLHTYEVARQRKLIKMLTADEVLQFEIEGLAGKFRRFVPAELDADQAFYLAAMRQLIAACRLPFYQRHETFVGIELEIEELAASDRYP